MATPVVTCGSNVFLNYSGSSQFTALSATATEGASSFAWELLSAPIGSTAFTETRGGFVNGLSTLQNPTFETDPALEGAYVFQCIATGGESSVPDNDKALAQQIVVVKTERFALTFANDYQWEWGTFISNSLSLLEAAIGTTAPPSHNHVKSDVTDFTHNHVAADVTDFDTEVSNNTDVAANTAARHTHTNKAQLDLVTDGDHDVRTDNPHATDIGNLGGGTLAELNTTVSDATLIDTTDSRLSDARTPTAHDLAGSEHNTATLAALNAKVSDATLIDTTDSRLSDSRTPTSHATSHTSGQSDAIKLDDLAAPDDNTDLDATTSAHGLLPKLGGGTTNFLRADGSWSAPAGGGSSPLTTKGDLYTFTTADARLGVGTDGYVLAADSSEAAGIKWAAPAGGGGGLAHLDATGTTAGAPDSLYVLDGTASWLTDRMSNGPTLTVSGSANRHQVVNGIIGMKLPTAQGSYLYANGATALDALTALTVEVLWLLEDVSGSHNGIYCYGSSSLASANDNMQYSMYLNTTNAETKQVAYYSESGTNVGEVVISDNYAVLYQPRLDTITRDGSTGELKFYTDGVLMDTKASTLPENGGNTGSPIFQIGNWYGSNEHFRGCVFSWRMKKTKLSDAQVLEAAQQVGMR